MIIMERVENYGSMIEQVYLGSPTKSAFDRSHHNFLSGKLGTIIPTRLDEVYPGDRIKGHVQGVVNFEPLAAPIMGNMRYKQESFYVPDSIIWKNAHKFYTGKKGFNTPKPSVSASDIVGAYASVGLLPAIDWVDIVAYRDSFKPSEYSIPTFVETYEVAIADFATMRSNLVAFGEEFQVLDLIQPLLDLLDEYFLKVSSNGNYVSKMSVQINEDIRASVSTWSSEARLLCEFYCEYMSFLFGASSMLDYMGFPCYTDWKTLFLQDVYYDISTSFTPITPPFESLNALFSDIPLVWLPFRAAYVVWYWNYRDELLETDALDPESDDFLADTPRSYEIVLLTLMRRRCWYKDTFTTALTHTGDGNLSVPVVIGSQISSETTMSYYDQLGHTMDNVADYESALQAGATICGISIGNLEYKVPMNYFGQQSEVTSGRVERDDVPTLSLDLFDRIKRLQKFVQKKLILGYEYDDVVWSSFLVKLSNVRMRIPEILGRGSDLVELNTIVNNTNTSEQIAGDKTAVAWAQGRQSDINYFAEEHGYFLSFMTILPIQSYSGGMQRLWLKREQFDVMWPEFATMGMDAVYNIELSAPRGIGIYSERHLHSSGLTDEQAMSVFGYQGRYYDLKSRQDEEHGRLRTDLNYLTFARDFDADNLPKLNYIFVHCHPALDMFVTDDPKEDVFRADIFHALDFERRLPVPSDFV